MACSLTGGLSVIAGQQPARADDTPVLLKDINPGAGASSPDSFAQFGGFTYFVSTDPATPRLWKTDGTTAATTLVKAMQNLYAGRVWGLP